MSETSRDVWANKGEPKYCRICDAQIFGNDDVCDSCQPKPAAETLHERMGLNPNHVLLSVLGLVLACPFSFYSFIVTALVAEEYGTSQAAIPSLMFVGSILLIAFLVGMPFYFQRRQRRQRRREQGKTK